MVNLRTNAPSAAGTVGIRPPSPDGFHAHEDFKAYELQYGSLHDEDLPIGIRQAYIDAGRALPQVLRNGAVVTPSPLGQCGHCGVTVAPGNFRMAHAVAGFEQARHLESGKPLRMLIDHCAACYRSDRCDPNTTSPGSGWRAAAHLPGSGFVGAGGFCEPLERSMDLGMVLIPGARELARWSFRAAKWALAACGLYLVANGVLVSQGQQYAEFQGAATALLAPGSDTTSGHGYNGGHLAVWDTGGSTPSDANASATGSARLIYWALSSSPQAFTASNALPSVATAATISDVTALASGTAEFARLIENGDTAWGLSTSLRRYQLTVGAGSGELSFNTLAISSGGTCSCTSLTITKG